MTNLRDHKNLTTRRRFLGAFLAAIAASAVGCAGLGGYHIGPDGLYNMEIKTVHVPMVEASTYRHAFAERLTEAIVKKITEQTPYRIATASNADSILTVKLTGETQSVSALNRYDDTRQKNVELTATAVWTDVRGFASVNQSPNQSLLSSPARRFSQSFSFGNGARRRQLWRRSTNADRIVGLMSVVVIRLESQK